MDVQLVPPVRKSSTYMTLEEHVSRHKFKYFGTLLVLGLINNSGYVMVGAGSQKIAEKFDKKELMGLFQFALIVFSSLVRFINTKYLLKVLHRYRIYTVCLVASLGYIVIAISCAATQEWGFYLSLVGSVMTGSMQAFGEGTLMGFIKTFPSDLVGGFSSGTGLAGIFGSLTFIALNGLGVNLTITFLVLVPLEAVYLLFFFYLEKKKTKYGANTMIVQSSDADSSNSLEKSDSQIKKEEEEQQYVEDEGENSEDVDLPESDADASQNVQFTIESFKRIHPKIAFWAVNISLVYFFEYCCISGFANKITDRLQQQHKDSDGEVDGGFWIKESYEILNFSYQFGVFLSRSSLSLIKVEKVWILTLFQLVNFLLYFSFAFWDYMPLYGLIPVMLWTGLMGGCSYVNVFYCLLNTDKLPKKEKEMAANIISIYNDFGVLMASLFSILADSVILKNR